MRRPNTHLIATAKRNRRKNQETAIFKETLDENFLTFLNHQSE